MEKSSGENSQSVIGALKASHLKEALGQYGEALRARRKGIDKLNVYPVPDGDTGTNMSLTVQSVVAELKDAVSDDMSAITSAISKGAIMGARGNSGAILAQVLRGVAESAKEKSSLGPSDVAEALEKARKSAYEAVLKPVEGTILTVVSAAAASAKEQAEKGVQLKEQLAHVRQASAEALARTPELLPVLKQAGVVDAGGSGFLLLVDALRYVVTGEPIPGATDEESGDDEAEVMKVEHTELSDLRYEIMFLLEGDDAGIPAMREAWSHVGDSIVVVGGDGLWNCHIHSDDVGQPIEIALDFGRPRQIRVTDLMEQVGAEHGGEWMPEAKSEAPAEPCTTAVVAVVNGDGLARIYRSMGVQELVIGGQSMNPSVAELLHAVETAPAECVVILPNNKNIILTAQQVNDVTQKTVVVVPTKSVVEGMSALLGYDSNSTAAVNQDSMQKSCEQVVTGEITQAVRATTDQGRKIKKNDWLGLGVNGISVIEKSLEDALSQLAEALITDEHEVLTLVEGEGASVEVTAAFQKWVAAHKPNVEVEVHEGGQPLYPYLLGVE